MVKTVPQLSHDKWILELAFLVDITTYLNELNVKLQGKGKFLSEMFSDVEAFETKLKLLTNKQKPCMKKLKTNMKICHDTY
jgi:uncharacterized pyridoxamine 5'-phosphate oxidase family protein